MHLKNKDDSKRKIAFADKIIIYCISMVTIITAVILFEYHRLDETIPSGILTGLLSFYGGELLIIALRQIFGSDVINKSNTASVVEEETDDEGSI